MKAIILAAGRGSRMCSLTTDKPKCLVELDGKSLLQWQLEALRGGGVEEIGLVRGYLADKLSIPGIKYFLNSLWAKTNMVMSLVCAKEWLQSDICIISYSDIVYSADTVAQLYEATGNIVITYDVNWLKLWEARFDDPLVDAETFQIDDKGKLLEIGNKAKSIDEINGQYMGLLKISPTGWRIIEDYLSRLTQEECDNMDMTSLLRGLIKEEFEINTVPINSVWYEVDNENDLKLYQSLNLGIE